MNSSSDGKMSLKVSKCHNQEPISDAPFKQSTNTQVLSGTQKMSPNEAMNGWTNEEPIRISPSKQTNQSPDVKCHSRNAARAVNEWRVKKITRANQHS